MGSVMTGTWQRDKLLAAAFIYLFICLRLVDPFPREEGICPLCCVTEKEYFFNQRQEDRL